MGKVSWIALWGSCAQYVTPLLLSFLFYTTTSGISAAADGASACERPIARVVSIQASVEVQRAGQTSWSALIRLDTPLCAGDRLRTGPQSRAALFIQPETLVRVDQNTSVVINATSEETSVEFSQEELVPVSTDARACGAGYFITRFPRKFKVKTPHLNAAVEGTEFLVALRCESTDLSVFEGKVLASSAGANVFPSQSVVSGQTLTVGGSEPPAIKLQLKPADAVQWTLYYPPITPADTVPVKDCRDVASENRAPCLIARAERLLRTGQVEAAQANIDDALNVAPHSSDAKALSSIIRLVKNDKTEALRLAKEAVDASPDSAPAWLALSYAQQADFKLEAALTSAKRAAELTPSSALALARVAELQLSLGWTREAEKSAKKAVEAGPTESRAHMILGFVHLAQINVKETRENFERAIELDSTEPLSRLGLGLTIIRKGNLIEGREQIEIAVALDPTNSLIRSYVGKAYYEENSKERDQLASAQFGLAKGLDPQDPTPWFYDAILKQTQNRPEEAFSSIQQSIALNDQRAVYRASLLLDQDRAARTVSLGRAYSDLGFTALGIFEGGRAATESPDSYSAHRFLADSYLTVPRFGAAMTAEALQSQVLQPAEAGPVQLRLLDPNQLILDRTGPPTVSFQEFNPLFERNGVRFALSAVGGERGTFGDEAVFSVVENNSSVGVSQFHYETQGFRANEDYKLDLQQFFFQHNVSYATTFQFTLDTADRELGDVTFNFDPDNFSREFRRSVESQSARATLRHTESPTHTFLASIAAGTRKDSFSDQFTLDLPFLPLPLVAKASGATDSDIYSGDLQYIGNWNELSLIVGASQYEDDRVETQDLLSALSDGTVLDQFSARQDTATRQLTGYVYGIVRPEKQVQVLAGLSADSLTLAGFGHIDQVNPKFGVLYEPFAGTALRTATFRYLKRSLAAPPSLEPSQVVGFNQIYDDPDGTESHSYAFGINQRFAPTLYAGAEYVHRNLSIPITVAGSTFTSRDDWYEKLLHLYISWAMTSNFASNLAFRHDIQERNDFGIGVGLTFAKVDTKEIPLTFSYNHPSGVYGQITGTYVDQKVGFPDLGSLRYESDSFWIVDLAAGYRLPGRRGSFGFVVKNLVDERFNFQDTTLGGEPRQPRFSRGRLVLGLVSLVF